MQTGAKFDLVLRLVQSSCGTGAPKRAATEDDGEGKQVLKKRKPSTKPADLDALKARVHNKAHADDSKWSNNQFKRHAENVVGLCNTIIDKEAFEKGFVERADPFALEVALAVLQQLDAEWDHLSGQGYSSWETTCLADTLTKLAHAFSRSNLSPLSNVTARLHCKMSQYSIDELSDVVTILAKAAEDSAGE